MNDIQFFNYENRQVRTIVKDNEPWFVAKDVAEVLGYTNPQKATRDHCKKYTNIGVNDSFTLDPQTIIIPESDIYRMIIRSNLPSAEKFETWIVEEVIPSIRKTGTYSIPQKRESSVELIARAVVEAQKLLAEKDQVIAQLTPKAGIYDTCMNSESTLDMGIVARMFGYGRNTFFSILKEKGILMENRTPYQRYSHYFKMIENPKTDKYGTVRVFPAPTLKQIGLDFIAKLLGKTYDKEIVGGLCQQK